MTRVWTHNLDCPKCGNKQDVHIWESVNIKEDPELREKVFQMEINIFACQQCREKTFISTPLMYHDMDKHFCVQYYPSEELEDDTFYEQFTKNGHLRCPENVSELLIRTDGMYIFRPHIVFNMKELIQYIIFREGLFRIDKAIEQKTTWENPDHGNDVDLLINFVRDNKDFQVIPPDISVPYNHMGATITNAILQAGLKWESVVKPRIMNLRDNHPTAKTGV